METEHYDAWQHCKLFYHIICWPCFCMSWKAVVKQHFNLQPPMMPHCFWVQVDFFRLRSDTKTV